MTEQTQTPADESNDQAAPDSADGSAEDLSIDELLSEFEQEQANAQKEESEQPTQKDGQDSVESTAKLDSETESRIRAVESEMYNRAIDEAIKLTKGDDLNVDDKVVRALLEQDAARDPRFMRAWVNRANNPVAYEKILKAKGKEYAKMFQPVDQDATQQKKDIVAAVQGSKTKGSPSAEKQEQEFASKVSKMSDQDLQSLMYQSSR